MRGIPWCWHAAPAAAFDDAVDLHPGKPPAERARSDRFAARMFMPALWLAAAAMGLHVVATVAEWSSLKFAAWREAREWTALASAAGLGADAAADPTSARAALVHRYAELRHAHGKPAPDDALPLLARATPALGALPPGTLKSANYGGGHWTLDFARVDPSVIRDLDSRMRTIGMPALIATSADGTRVRFGGP